jgi:hypothetical protein
LLLRSALWRAWGYRCYWCSEPRDLLDVVIDQMIPRAQGRRPRSDARREPDPRTSSTSVQHRRSAQPGPHLPALQWREERHEFFWDAPLYVTAGEGTHSGAASGKTLSQVSQEERVAFPLSAIGRTGGGGPSAWQPPKRRGPCRGGGADPVADPTVARYSSASSAWLLGRRRGSAGCGRAGSETYLPMLPQMMG